MHSMTSLPLSLCMMGYRMVTIVTPLAWGMLLIMGGPHTKIVKVSIKNKDDPEMRELLQVVYTINSKISPQINTPTAVRN